MLRHRFGEALIMDISITPQQQSEYLIPPLSIFFAVENAVKHNEINIQHPLVVSFKLSGSSLYIHNHKVPKVNLQPSSGIGLKNLKERFRIIVNQEVIVDNE